MPLSFIFQLQAAFQVEIGAILAFSVSEYFTHFFIMLEPLSFR